MKKESGILFLLALLACIPCSYGQLSFPNGKSIDLHTDQENLYFETQLLFNTGKRKADEYKYVKISDSVDSRWFLSSCMNGECLDQFPDSGTFMRFGINDSTCFIAFHVGTYGYAGKSVIRYRVENRFDSSEKADLTISVTYSKPSGIADPLKHSRSLTLYPNPAWKEVYLKTAGGISGSVQVVSLSGQELVSKEITGNAPVKLDISGLREGFYFVRLLTHNGYHCEPLTILR